MKLETRVAQLRIEIEKRVAALILAHGKDTARRIVIKSHNTSTSETAKLNCQIALHMISSL